MAKVSLKNVYKRYGQVEVVKDFNLEIEDGEFIVFVGPSGCGKTTTLRMIAGLEEISAGEIFIGDVKVNDLPPKDRDIAMVFQNYALYPHMNVYDNMAFGVTSSPQFIEGHPIQDARKVFSLRFGSATPCYPKWYDTTAGRVTRPLLPLIGDT